MNAAPDYFSLLAAAGFASRLIPICPPDARVRADSVLVNGRDNRGKAPGRLEGGLWDAFKGWRTIAAGEAELAAWRDWGAGVGIRCTDQLMGLDADTLDPGLATIIKEEIDAAIGPVPMRIGRPPKALYVFRTAEKIGYGHVLFEGGEIELLSSGQQFVAHGVHPITKSPYTWPRPLISFEDLPIVSSKDLSALLERLRVKLPKASKVQIAESNALEVDQESLKGSKERVEAALNACINDERFNSRALYFKVVCAVNGASGGAPWGFDLLWDWSQTWTGGENDRAVVERDWNLRTPPRIGIGWLEDLANQITGGKFKAEKAFEEPLFPSEEKAPELEPLKSFTAASLHGLEIAPQEWLVRDLIPARNVTMLSGDGGTGKSLITLQLAVAIATGKPWLGEATEAGRVLFLTAEDEREELHRRLDAVARAEAIDLTALERLHLVSMSGEDAVMAAPSGQSGLLQPTIVFKRLCKLLGVLHPALIVLDTQADLFGGDENKRIHARQFIGMLQGLVKRFKTTVMLLSHPSMSGLAAKDGKSGNTAWNNSVRSRLYLERRFIGKDPQHREEPDVDVRVLTVKKANRTRIGRAMLLRYAAGCFVLESARATRNAAADMDADHFFLKMLTQFTASDRVVTDGQTSKNYAPRIFAHHPDAGGMTVDRLEDSMNRLFSAGRIQNVNNGSPSKRMHKLARTDSDYLQDVKINDENTEEEFF